MKRIISLAGLALVAAAAILIGLKWRHATRRPAGPATDLKAAIYQLLATKSGTSNFQAPFDFELRDRVALLRSNANAWEQRTVGLRTSIRAAEEGAAPLRKELDALRNETLKAKRAVGESRARLKEAESRVPPNPAEAASGRSEHEKNDRAWTARRDEIATKEEQIAAREQETTPLVQQLRQQLRDAETELQAAASAVRPLESELGRQENAFIRSTRERASEARSYEAIYLLIGQQLFAADKLLTSPDLERRRMAVGFAREACGHAGADAVDPWLAARICEAYFWPNLEWADYTAGSKERAQDMLRTCRSVFSAVAETENVLRTCDLMIAHAETLRAADTFRLELADLLEQTGDDAGAARRLGEIKDAEVSRLAEPKLAQLKQRLPATP